MAFSDFKNVFEVSEKYGTILETGDLFDSTPILVLPEYLVEDLAFSFTLKKPSPSEIALSANFISPMIRFVTRRHPNLTYWSREYDLRYDDMLFGTPDYLFTYTEKQSRMTRSNPLICVAEAKVDNFTNAWGQALAEMVACQKLFADMIIYGFTTNGLSWEFGKLENNIFTQDEGTYSITENPTKIAGILDWIFTDAVKQAKRHLKIAF